jgi:general secretion pathway protein I
MWSTERRPGEEHDAAHRYGVAGFTLLEVLVALVIVAIALGAGLRAVGSLTQGNEALRKATLATWSAENRLVQIRLDGASPSLGTRSLACPQAELQLICSEVVAATANAGFRRVEIMVYESGQPDRALANLVDVVGNAG